MSMKERKCQINGYQLVWPDGRRDTVKLSQPVICGDIEAERGRIKKEHEGASVNLSYTEFPCEDDEEYYY